MSGDSFAGLVGVVFVLFIIALLYFLPWLIAGQRKHRNETSILILNFFVGWTFIGWVACLVWAFSNDTRPPQYIDMTRGRRLSPLPPPPSSPEQLAATPVAEEKACPYCESLIPLSAKKCRACGEWVVPEADRTPA